MKLSKEIEKTFKLPDGQMLKIGNERFRCPEALFNPFLIGSETMGIHERIYKSIMKCDIDTRKEFYKNIILTSGSTMFYGLRERLHKELTCLVPEKIKINLITREERKYSVWIGGSILASLSCYKPMWITKCEYKQEIGYLNI